jgi:hypothetical protein
VFSYAQAKGMYSANPVTGGIAGKGPHYNPLSGIYRRGVYFSPGNQEVQKPAVVGTVVKSVCQRWLGYLAEMPRPKSVTWSAGRASRAKDGRT